MFNPFDSKFIYVNSEIWLDSECATISRLLHTDNDTYAVCEITFQDGYIGRYKLDYCYSSLAYGPHFMLEPDSEYYIKNVYPKIGNESIESFMKFQEILWDHAVVY